MESRVDLEPEIKEISINLYPNPVITGDALRDLIKYLNWTKIAVIYEQDLCKFSICFPTSTVSLFNCIPFTNEIEHSFTSTSFTH